ncbi:aldo/keto reductase [Lactobacillus sp. LC28-10]|uniref:Aldo/keto reductase n=1 Tax=Secundilactobacillus angelensis TaxID=2722706 RepID=A0ABX1L0D3_9LACO|nr:aldo/keto reductase [Secundilactobacillus angelensis]MCH5463112.1 aldo/keto reductase [Secundilactobacillus angelensis]NLR18965.1 aldo/keto reductase [Secundilactobacillus angelensis]
MYAADENRYDGRMPVRRAGNKGLQLPGVSFGLWHSFGNEANYADSEKIILKAFDSGIFSFDLAYNYGPGSGAAERLFGQIYQANLKAYRDELVITTKAGFHMWPGPYGEMSSRKTLINALDGSLKRMGLNYVDIFYSHRFDPNTDLEETAVALDDIVRSGKALYVGISNYNNAQTKAIIKIFKDLHTPFVVNQLSYNMLNREVENDGVLDTLKANNLGMIAYGPLAEGLLTNRYLGGIPEDFQIHWSSTDVMDQGRAKLTEKLNQLNDIAMNRGQTMAQMSLAWLLKDPVVVSVVTGASKASHLEDNLKAVQNIRFSADELEKIDSIIKG